MTPERLFDRRLWRYAPVDQDGPQPEGRMPPSRTGRAFTLVELLVVIGIIAVLLAVLLSALAAARSQANRLRCATHVRTLAQAALQYAHDNKGWIPRNYGD